MARWAGEGGDPGVCAGLHPFHRAQQRGAGGDAGGRIQSGATGAGLDPPCADWPAPCGCARQPVLALNTDAV